MSIVTDQVRRLDARIDRVSLVPLTHLQQDHDAELPAVDSVAASALASPRLNELLGIVKALSSGSVSGAHLSSPRIQRLLQQSGLTGELPSVELLEAKSQYETDVEWLLVGKATVQTYGLLMSTLLDQIIPLSDDIWYWDEVLTSYPYSFVYTVQTSPLRMWKWSKEVYSDSVGRFQRLYRDEILGQASEVEDVSSAQQDGSGAARKPKGFKALYPSLSKHWLQFYGIVRQSVAERSIADIQRKILSRVDIGRSEARYKQKRLRRLREMTATGLGVLLDEGLNFGITEETNSDEWKGLLERSVALMDMILQSVLFLDLSVSEFEDKVFAGVEEDPELSIHIEDSHPAERPAVLARRLLGLLQRGLPHHRVAITDLARQHGRPSRLVRYWLPAAALLVSSSTILRILINRQDDIVTWIRDFGSTAHDFWFNWVVDPVRKIVGTIRHDSNSEIAIMSRDSLKADRDSLERMVVEFAIDNPDIAVGNSSITEFEIGEIRSKVKEGDVTPVLKAYEKDLRRPIVGAIRGDLVRSLLIQVQKTKVDLEVAISGIDALLKSQELVFGFVGLTPGVLVSIGVFQYLRTVFGSRRGLRQGRRVRRSVRVLRKIDRILSEATTSQNNIISYRDHGLLVCEVHVLRGLAHGVLPGDVEKEFIEDVDELANLKGIQVQMKALERIRWAYAEWLSRMR
ncbi:ATP synthase regulation protein NCA2-domain-containing protein [Parachaetomium inaequale]|uniref:ATP synthase regulation protein NCA2-domain-containing protein n=1 Tax=Parachaetomium inaequale TaxID=2588326 RepID=A0AAN6PR22_9PEZI|nr:ATP synthase regulation protein NCA2-domain-containing protein [Parachaetomium inaequale]